MSKQTARRLSLPVYPQLPPMTCKEGCGDCCGPVSCSAAELKTILEFARRHSVTAYRQGLQCPFFMGGCTIYPVRPFICRVFGHTRSLPCPHGRDVLDPSAERRLDAYIGRHDPSHLLHSLVYSPEEMKQIIDQKEVDQEVETIKSRQEGCRWSGTERC